MRILASTVLFALFFSVGCAVAEVTSQSEFRSANLAIQSESNDQALPSLANPDTRKLVLAAFDTQVLDQIKWRDVNSAFDFCDLNSQSLKRYLAPRAMISSKDFNPVSPSSQRVLISFGAKYHDEQALAMRFNIDCSLRYLEESIGPFWSALPPELRTNERRTGVIQVQMGISEQVNGTLKTLAEPIYTSSNKTLILDALERNAAAFGRATDSPARSLVLQQIIALQPTLSPEIQLRLKHLAETIKSTPCTALCK